VILTLRLSVEKIKNWETPIKIIVARWKINQNRDQVWGLPSEIAGVLQTYRTFCTSVGRGLGWEGYELCGCSGHTSGFHIL
jgi:hypothetical protein